MEKGTLDLNTEWNMACFIIENVDANIGAQGNRHVNFTMSYEDIKVIKNNLKRLETSIEELSGEKMNITYDVIEIKEPLTSISYDEENEYYVSQQDIDPLIAEYIQRQEYDYIYIAVRLGDLSQSSEVLVHDWIGLRCNGI